VSAKRLIRILTGELPFDCSLLGVSRYLPSIDLGLQQVPIGYSSIQALAAEDADLDFRHVLF